VEVVLAYKGAIFGSLMVYIYPPLMFAALSAPGAAPPCRPSPFKSPRSLLRSAEATQPMLSDTNGAPAPHKPGVQAEAPPKGTERIGRVIVFMLSSRRHRLCAVLFVWGCVSSVLGVGMTIKKQVSGG
jgi:hypothetical protein